MLDQSNDVSVRKLLGVSEIYFSDNTGQVVSTYLALVQLEQCNVESIVVTFKRFSAYKKLDFKDLAAIGTNNESVLVGINWCLCKI